ncbi:unnamed protein product, partial [Didymodactylos carnosus]
MSQLKL